MVIMQSAAAHAKARDEDRESGSERESASCAVSLAGACLPLQFGVPTRERILNSRQSVPTDSPRVTRELDEKDITKSVHPTRLEREVPI